MASMLVVREATDEVADYLVPLISATSTVNQRIMRLDDSIMFTVHGGTTQ